VIVGVFVKPPVDSQAAWTSASESADPIERARAFFLTAKDIAVPVDPDTLAIKRENVDREDINFYMVYAKPSLLPGNTSYQLMTGSELLASFLRISGRDVDLLFIRGARVSSISRGDAVKVASTLPAALPSASAVLRSP